MRVPFPVLLLACAAALPMSARAADGAAPFGGMFSAKEGRSHDRLAELSPEQRAEFRQKWQSLPPKEREALLRKLKQQWREVPPEERQKQRVELIQRMRGTGSSSEGGQEQERLMERPDDGFGLGFEARQWERPETGGGGGGGGGFGRNRN